MDTELWKPVVGYEGLYEVSSFGNVRSLDRIVKRKQGNYLHKGKMLKQFYCGYSRYLCVTLTPPNGESKLIRVHRLVAMAFLPNPENKPEVGHKDSDNHNNNVLNLEWVTRTENQNNPITRKRISDSRQGEKCWWLWHKPRPDLSKPVCQFTKDGELVETFLSTREAARKTGINQMQISYCCNGLRKGFNSAGGFIWKYKADIQTN